MNKAIACILILLYSIAVAQHPSTNPNWQLVFNDDFDADTLNTANWVKNIWWGRNLNYNEDDNSCYFNESPYYQPALRISPPNSHIANGICTLTVSKVATPYTEVYKCYNDNEVIDAGFTITHTAEMLQSVNKFKYGYYEIKFLMPANPLFGFNYNTFGPNFWLFGQVGDNERSEIDVFENNYYGEGIKYTYNCHYQYPNEPSGRSIESQPMYWPSGLWHTSACNWTSDRIEFYFDDILVRTIYPTEYEWIVNWCPMQILVDINSPSNLLNHETAADDIPLTANSVGLPYYYCIDYVKVWQLKE